MSKECIEYYDGLLFLFKEYNGQEIPLWERHKLAGTLLSKEHTRQRDALFNEYVDGKAKLAATYNEKEPVT